MQRYIDANLIAQLEPSSKERERITDTEITGYYLRVSPSGALGFYLSYRVKAGIHKGTKRNFNLVSGDLARYQAMNKTMQRQVAKQWRDLAVKTRAQVDGGGDPAGDLSAEREVKRQAALERKQKQAQSKLDKVARENAEKNTIAALCAENGEYTLKYLKTTKSGEATRKMMLNAWESIAEDPIVDITREDIEVIIDDWVASDELALSSIDRYISVLKAFCNWCIDKKKLGSNPCRGIKRKAKSFDYNQPYKALEVAEVKKLYKEISKPKYPAYFPVLVKLAINTGMRRSECLNLQWTDIYSGNINIQGAFSKNDKSHHIKMNTTVTELLRAWQTRDDIHRATGRVFEGETEKLTNQVKRLWPEATAAVGIDAGFHSTRHTFAARLAKAGVSIHRISQMLNHSSLEVTMRYAREYNEHLDDAKELDGMFD